MKKAIVIVVVFLFAASAVFAMGKKVAAPQDEVTVQFTMIYGDAEEPGWKGMVDAFNAQSEYITVNLEKFVAGGSWPGYTQKMQAMVAAGDPPDIGRFTPTFVPGFAENGLLVDMMPMAKAEDFDFDQFYQSALDTVIKDGKMFAFPAGIYTQATYFNKTLFDEAGLDYPDEDWTIEDMIVAAQRLTKGEGADKVYGMYLDFGVGPERLMWYFWANGADLFDASRTKCAFDTPEAIEALEVLQDIMWEYEVAPTPSEYGTKIWYDRFIEGKLAIIQEGAWMIPGFSNVLKDADFEWSVAPYPKGPAGRHTFVWADPYVIFSGSSNPQAAWEVVKFFVTEGANKLVDASVMGYPVSKKVAAARVNDLFNPLSAAEKQVWVKSLDYARNIDFPPNWMEMRLEIVKGLETLALNKATPEEVAEMICKEVNRLLGEL